MLLMVEKKSEEECVTQDIMNIWKLITNTKKYHILSIEMHIIYMDGQCLENYLEMTLNGKIYI